MKLFGQSKEPPLEILFPRDPSQGEYTPLPGFRFFILLHIFVLLNVSALTLLPSHPIRQWLSRGYHSTPYTLFIPLPSPVLLGLSTLTPLFALLKASSWSDMLWWCLTGVLTGGVYALVSGMADTAESIRTLEGLKYDAKGA